MKSPEEENPLIINDFISLLGSLLEKLYSKRLDMIWQEQESLALLINLILSNGTIVNTNREQILQDFKFHYGEHKNGSGFSFFN